MKVRDSASIRVSDTKSRFSFTLQNDREDEWMERDRENYNGAGFESTETERGMGATL